MQLNQLYCFMEAVKYHSISVAAEQNYISQSSFSSSISRLEKELGVSLLKRTNTGIALTDYGKYVMEQAKIIFDAQDKIIEASENDSFSGAVSISSIPGVYNRILPEAIHRLQLENSNVILSVITGESKEIAKNVSCGHSNLGIVICGVFLRAFKDIRYTPLFQDEYQLYVGRESPLWDRESVTLEEIKKLNYIAYRDEFRKENGGITELFQKPDYPSIAFFCDDPDFIKQMISRSNHVAFFPKYMSENDFYLEKGLIRGLPVADYDLTFEVGYIESKKFRLSFQEKKIIEVIKSAVDDLFEKQDMISGSQSQFS